MSVYLKKFFSNYGFGGVAMILLSLYALYMVYQYLAKKGMVGSEMMTGSSPSSVYDNAPSAGGQMTNNFSPQPASDITLSLGKNFYESQPDTVNKVGMSDSQNKQSMQNPADLLPKDKNSEWSYLNPSGAGALNDVNFLKAGYHLGINTLSHTRRNGNQQLRSEPPNPQIPTGPWNQPTITPDTIRPAFEIGQGAL